MKPSPLLLSCFFLAGALATRGPAGAQTTDSFPKVRPDAIVDLGTDAGAELVKATWRYHDARIVEVDHRGPGPDLRASGAPNRTLDVTPEAGAAGFDDSDWPLVAPTELTARRSTGRLCFGWYRLRLELPETVGKTPVRGGTAVLEIVVDDYAEVWVNGELPVVLGQSGGPLVQGFNALNRVVLTHDARPGQQFEIAVFAANGPLSDPPANFLWVRSATVELFAAANAGVGEAVPMTVERLCPELDAVIPEDASLERVAGGFLFLEGPTWVEAGGYLLFSDPNANRIYRWSPSGQVSVFRTKSGYSGLDAGEYHQPGSNGLALDAEGRVIVCEHGNRRLTRLERNGVVTVLADRFEGKRLNSPNDVVVHSSGSVYFTDPPFGLPRGFDDPRKELPFSGVYRLADGRLTLESKELAGPNGLAFSPDEDFLYVSNWDPERRVVLRHAVHADGSLGPGELFFDMEDAPEPEALDGLEVDPAGNLLVSGPGGVWVLSPDGRHLGTLRGPELPANFAFGDADGRTLYLTARTGLYRIRLAAFPAGS